MGTLMGHILPGTFFAIFAIWWGFCIAVKHFHSRHSRSKLRKPNPYRASTTFSCLCCPSSTLRQMPLESYLKLICITIGILGETVTGLKHPYDDTLKRKTWTFVEVNAQHIAMFFSFGFASFLEILVHAKYNLPKGIEFLANIFAFAIEGFLFHFHLHGRDEVDIHVHTLLVYNIIFCICAGIWEYNRPNQILASYCRIAATLLQGAWFYAAGFILYFPSNDSYWIWSATHGHLLILTVMFIWFGILACVFLFIQSALVWSILKRRYRELARYSALNENDNDDEIDHEETLENSNNHQLKPFKTDNGNTIINIDNHEEDDSDSQIEFEQQRKHTSKI
ncbi:unnamed protein product [Rotaria sp. Silwood2]|nr:unnamed protein product [Rotaria sp. Silwood2]CAF2644251.1 unnamed protein product [Rotaria sp. Silwood2]CAF2903698.1 unnamed protein product [Rotaria sp. Silwood2]CAF3889587.1 unnamed protein product [Rotaria sp. Silwood2]CAF4037354.1 unnamed protein product [Rotaria sp. Silwood2]